MRRSLPLALSTLLCLSSCQYFEDRPGNHEKYTQFVRVDEIELAGGETAAEISAFDSKTNRLFTVNAVKGAIDVIDMSDPFNLVYEQEISITAYGGGVNSVAVNNGLLAAAVEAVDKTAPGKVVVWNTSNLSVVSVVQVGSLPDMVAFSENGRYIVSANEGEPNEDYTVDPVGSVSIIRIPGYRVSTIDFGSWAGSAEALKKKGFRTPGRTGITFAQDVEPEYVAISKQGDKAWVTLQENNAVARIDLNSARIEAILPLGYKDHSKPGSELDPTDRGAGPVQFVTGPVLGMYLPDGIATFGNGLDYIITANEGDSRIRPTSDDALPPLKEGALFNEEARIGGVKLDTIKFPNYKALQNNANFGRLKITNRQGDTDGDGDYDELYSFGARSFTIRNGASGNIVFEAGSALEKFLIEQDGSLYDDSRSDDKGAEPESVEIGKIGPRTIAFIGLERADAVVVVDVTSPGAPIYLQVLHTGDAPEGLLFIPAKQSPNKKSLLVTSCEGDGTVQVFQLSGDEEELAGL
ncbi:MAG: choice-of-anchor I family protein [Chryseolinea sp.]